MVAGRQGRYQEAAGHHRQALALFREIGDRYAEAHVLAELGTVDQRLGHHQQAARHLRRAVVLFRETGDRAGEAEALNGLGESLLATGQPGQARLQHAAALGLASKTGDRYEQARAHNGLVAARRAAGDPDQTYRWQEARTRYTELGAAEAGQARDQLAAHGIQGHRRWLAPGRQKIRRVAERSAGLRQPSLR